ncbi:MAG: methyltransferase domain-containing protein [Candidatus Nezhaarchaeales archaeon]
MSIREKRRVLRSYDATAKGYWRLYGEEQLLKYKVALAGVKLKADYVVADVGCGTARLVKRLSRRVGFVVGVDGSIAMLKRGLPVKLANTCLIQADADHLPFKSKAFHMLFSITLIQNLPNLRLTLNEWYRVLRRKSMAVLSVPRKDGRIKSLADALTEAKFINLRVVENQGLADVVFFLLKA